MTYGNSLTFSATFDQDYYPTNRTVSGGIANNTYDTDDNGNITQAGTPTYGYDALNRVNAENPGSAISYTYDATSNRLTKVQGSTTTTTVPSGSNKISAVGGNSYTYDNAGNITNDGTNAYAWSNAGLLATVNTTGGVYTYNVANQRTKKVSGGVTTYYVYGAGGLLYGEYNSAGAMIREYVYLNGAPLAQIDAGSPQVLTYLHVDHLGTPRYGTNSGGTSVWAWTADAFGTSTPTGSATVNLRMPGQYYDSESGLFYNWNRYYKPAIGRYISSDPIGLTGGLNTFNYADVSPVMWGDSKGLSPAACAVLPTACGTLVVTTANAARWLAQRAIQAAISNAMSEDNEESKKANAPLPVAAKPQGCTPASPQGEPDPDDEDPDNNANKRQHIFGKPDHNLDGLVKELGSEEKVFTEVRSATQKALEQSGTKGVYTTEVVVAGRTVTVRGRVVDGVVRIGSFWIKK